MADTPEKAQTPPTPAEPEKAQTPPTPAEPEKAQTPPTPAEPKDESSQQMSYENYQSKNTLRLAFRAGHCIYADGQSSYSVKCQEARQNGRLPMTDAVKSLRFMAASRGLKLTITEARRALRSTHDGEWYHVSKYGNRVNYYDTKAALAALLAAQELFGKSDEAKQNGD